MLKLLLRIRFQSWLSYLTGSGKKGTKLKGKGRIALMGLLYAYIIGVFGFLFYAMFSAVAGVYHSLGLDWFYFATFTVLAFAMMFMFSVFTAKAQLFEARDNELLLSLPVPPGAILASRLISLLLINFGFELLVALPAVIAWCMSCSMTLPMALAMASVCLCLPFFSLAVSALFGWLLAVISSRVRRKSLVTTAMSIAFLAAYFYVYSKINVLMTALVENAGRIADSLSAALPVYWLGMGVAEGDLTMLLGGLACLIVPFLLVYFILAKTFIKTATTRRGFAKARYVERAAKTASPFAALVRREWLRLVSSSTYIMNAAMGALLSVAAAAALLIKGRDMLAVLDMLPAGLVSPILVLLLCAISSMTTLTASAVSLEGKNLWIVRSMPVATKTVLLSKLALHLLVSQTSTLLVQIAACIVFRPAGLMLLWVLLLPQLFGFVVALLGLWANLRHARLDWESETQAVKQGISVVIAMFGGWGLVLVPIIPGVLLSGLSFGMHLAAVIFLAILAALAVVLYRWCVSRGVEVFESL